MKVLFTAILAVLTFSTMLFGAELKRSDECLNPSFKMASQLVNKQMKIQGTMLGVQTMRLQELNKLQFQASALAVTVSVLMALSLGLLAGLLTYKYTVNKNFRMPFSIAMGHIYFFLSLFILSLIPNPVGEPVRDLKSKLTPYVLQVPQISKPSDFIKLKNLFANMKEKLLEVPYVYHLVAENYPVEPRWWTMGWEDAAMVEYELETTKTLKIRYEQHLAASNAVLNMIKKSCPQSFSHFSL